MKEFNVTGNCVPDLHYMVDMSDKIEQIVKMVNKRQYFTINRARQYGKTTILGLLEKTLQTHYRVARISFENLDEEDFATAGDFCETFIDLVAAALETTGIDKDKLKEWQNSTPDRFSKLSKCITNLCEGDKVVLIIDEVDRTSNNRVFLKFLSTLRSKYLARNEGKDTTFHSVILAGVTDIKNLKLMMTVAGNYTPRENEGKNNSPWNIAADFDVDLSFSSAGIATMLQQYEADHQTAMDITELSQEIYRYTRGYPFLVSRICQCIDGKLDRAWTLGGVQAAVKVLLEEKNTLFDDMSKNFENNPELYDFAYAVLIDGEVRPFTIDDPYVNFGVMLGYFRNNNGQVAIANRVFEIRMTNYFIMRNIRTKKQIKNVVKSEIIKDNKFNMQLCLEKFAIHYKELYNPKEDAKFVERHGRMVFLSYLKPLINGYGFYHIESGLTDYRRMDIVVDYGTDQFIIELKLWSGDSDHDKAYTQLLGYMNSKNAAEGYLLTFDFRQDANKQRKAEWVLLDGKRIFDVVV